MGRNRRMNAVQAVPVVEVLERRVLLSGWCTTARLNSPDPFNDQYFGQSAAIDGDTVMVAALENDPAAGEMAGAVYFFDRAGSGWRQTAKLTAPDAACYSSQPRLVDLQGDWAVVGAPNQDTADGTNAGAAYVFHRSEGTWSEVAHLFAPNGAPNENFGYAVALEGDRLFVGAPNVDNDVGFEGAVFVFERSGSEWTEAGKLPRPSGAAPGFGGELDAEGDTLVVGGGWGDTYVFRQAAPDWVLEAALRRQTTNSVSLAGDHLVVGGSDLANAYHHDSGVWTHAGELEFPEDPSSWWFGRSVAVDGDRMIVGEAGGIGAAYSYEWDGSSWARTATLGAYDILPGWGGNYGISVDLDGRTAVISRFGAPVGEVGSAGAVYVLEYRDDPSPEVSVDRNDVSIASEDLTPCLLDGTDFWRVEEGGGSLARTFTVYNTGTAPLTLGAVSVPSGYTLTEGLPGALSPGSSDSFTVQLATGVPGTFAGDVTVATNDLDEGAFRFRITGEVTPSGPPEAELEIRADRVLPGGSGTLKLRFTEPVQKINLSDVSVQEATLGTIALSGVSVAPDGRSATVQCSEGLSPVAGLLTYTVRLRDSVRDVGGNHLDGDGDGVAGGDYVETFSVLLYGDANADGIVGIADLASLADNYGAGPDATWIEGDFSRDGIVGIADLSALADNYGSSVTGGSTGVAVDRVGVQASQVAAVGAVPVGALQPEELCPASVATASGRLQLSVEIDPLLPPRPVLSAMLVGAQATVSGSGASVLRTAGASGDSEGPPELPLSAEPEDLMAGPNLAVLAVAGP